MALIVAEARVWALAGCNGLKHLVLPQQLQLSFSPMCHGYGHLKKNKQKTNNIKNLQTCKIQNWKGYYLFSHLNPFLPTIWFSVGVTIILAFRVDTLESVWWFSLEAGDAYIYKEILFGSLLFSFFSLFAATWSTSSWFHNREIASKDLEAGLASSHILFKYSFYSFSSLWFLCCHTDPVVPWVNFSQWLLLSVVARNAVLES